MLGWQVPTLTSATLGTFSIGGGATLNNTFTLTSVPDN